MVRFRDKDYEIHYNGNYGYIVVDKEVVIMKYTGSESSVSIPKELDGMKVTAIGWDERGRRGAFQENSSIQTITIPGTITFVAGASFYKCSGLQQVLIGEGVEEIGEDAFYGCEYLQTVKFQGNTLKYINASAFYGCSVLDDFQIPSSVTKIGDNAFAYCKGLSSIVIPDSVETLGGGAFGDCTNLISAVVGNGVISMSAAENNNDGNDNTHYYRYGVFENCSKLESVIIGSNVENIGIDTFAGTALKSVDIPDSVITIEQGAFYNCKSLEEVKIGKKVRTIGNTAFTYDSSLKSINIPSNVENLGEAAFYCCSGLTSAVIGNGVTDLKSGSGSDNGDDNSDYYTRGTFENCTSLSSVTIGNGVKNIGTDTFANTALTEVVIPDNVVTMEKGVFYNCKKLQKIIVGNGTTTIGNYAFYNCENLKDIKLSNSIISIGEEAFIGDNALEELLIPSSVTSLGAGLCYNCASLKKVIVGNGVTSFESGSGSDDGVDNSNYYRRGAFENCTNLTDVALGNALVSIGVDTFASTKINTLLLPSKVTTVEKGAFYNGAFGKIYFTGSAPKLGESLFGNSSVALLYKTSTASGYDKLDYSFSDYTPISVKFDLNDDDVFAIAPTTQYKSPDGGYVIEPISPTAEGYLFLGWYHDSACTTEWNFLEDKVTEDTTVYAKWVKISDTVPESPKNITTSESKSKSAKISWDAVSGATKYKVLVDGKVVADSVDTTSYKLTNLEPESAYEVVVIAVNDKGDSENSLVKVVYTEKASEEDDPSETPGPSKSPGPSETPDPSKTPGPSETPDPTETPDPSEDILHGDINLDGKVDLQDANMSLRAALGIEKDLSEDAIWAGDVNKDNSLDLQDTVMILKGALGIIILN